MNEIEIKKVVRDGYASVAIHSASCCGEQSSCCSNLNLATDISRKIGYSDTEIASVPEGANLGLGCGNPVALISLKEGDIVLDLGAGAGFDCFLVANKVGSTGKVIGVDMTPEMLDKARDNARKGKYENVEFRLGEIENLPVADHYVHAVISNCVINLVPNKQRVFNEAFRVLKSGGRLIVSDIVLLKQLPEVVMNSIKAYIGCVSGAALKNDYLSAIELAGFSGIKIIAETSFPIDCIMSDPSAKTIIGNLSLSPEFIDEFSNSIVSIQVSATKP